MPSFESRVTRLSDTGAVRFRVEFIGDKGESVAVECLAPHPDGEEPSRDELVDNARRIAAEVAAARGSRESGTAAGASDGLTRPVEDTEAKTHSSEGRDWGTA